MAVEVGDDEAERNDVEEAGLLLGIARRPQPVANMEQHLVRAGFDAVAAHGRVVELAVGAKLARRQQPAFRGQRVKLHPHALGGDAARHIHAMDRNSASHAVSIFGSPKW